MTGRIDLPALLLLLSACQLPAKPAPDAAPPPLAPVELYSPDFRPALGTSCFADPRFAEAAGPMALFDPDPQHPWNRLYDVLFTYRLDGISLEACLRDAASPLGSRCEGSGRSERARYTEGGDANRLLLRGVDGWRGEVSANSERTRRTLAALDAAIQAASGRGGPEAAVLLQNDLWERFDTLGPSELRTRLGRAIRALALPATRIAAIRPNLGELVRTYPDLLGDLEDGHWRELLPADRAATTNHAQNDGWRSAFRVLLRVPQGREAWLSRAVKGPATLQLPVGSRVILMQSPFAISDRGDIVPVPLVTLVEQREVIGPHRIRPQVLEGKRALLGSTSRPCGGLERLRDDHPIQVTASCILPPRELKPLRPVCSFCHTDQLASQARPLRLAALDPAPRLSAAIARKRASPEWRALASYFSPQ